MNDQDKNRAELQSCTDEELVRMAHRGNRDAEEFLISKYKSLALYKSKSYFIAGGDKDDVVQEGNQDFHVLLVGHTDLPEKRCVEVGISLGG